MLRTLALICTGILVAAAAQAQTPMPKGRWIPLFNGKNLDGWTPKIKGFDLGEDTLKTFRVERGVLKVSFQNYEKFDNRFGHLFYKTPFSHYILRVEYRFVGEQCPGGPGWAFRNSGAMLHCQDPKTMRKEQDFPVCIEAQLLGGDGTNERTTNNVCTPGTHIVMGGKLVTQHCNSSRSKTYHGDQWVTVEIEVRADGSSRHIIEGQTVFEYTEPQLDEKDTNARKLIESGADRKLRGGYIALQAESHPLEFRKVEVRPLGK